MPLRDDNGQLAVSDIAKCNLLSEKFGSVYTKDDGNLPCFHRKLCPNVSIDSVAFNESSVRAALRKLPAKTSNTPDGLPSLLLKRVADAVAAPLAVIFSLSFAEGVLPRIWLTANVAPVYKKNDASDPLNYRPISLTCICCKVMESIIRENVLKHLEQHKLISVHQHGFVSKKSTCTQLLECETDMSKYLRRESGVDVIYLDFAKAFDTVSHPKLLYKLLKYGIVGNLLSWISAFLCDRSQRVLLNGVASEPVSVKSSVPQGSCLGPLLFVLYVNDVVDCVSDLPVKIKLFADDVKIYASVANVQFLQVALDRIVNWSREWQLTLAKSKCTVLNLGKNSEMIYSIEGFELARNVSSRDLGVQLSANCKSSEHCCLLANKAMRRAGMIFRAFSSSCVDTLLKAYNVYVRPMLENGTQAWCPYLKKDIKAVERVQKFFTRIMFKRCGLQKQSYLKRLQLLGLDTLEIRRIRNDLVLYYKIMHGYSVLSATENFQRSANTETRGHSLKLVKPFCRTKFLENAFHVRRVNLWNNLTEKHVSAPSVNSFVSQLNEIDLHCECKGDY
jgi:hypothetical protein